MALTDNISNEERAKKIKVVIFDVDGVMTNGGLMLGDDGLEYKNFHSQDGLGLKLLHNTGIQMAIVTGRSSNVVTKRAENIKITHISLNFQVMASVVAFYRTNSMLYYS